MPEAFQIDGNLAERLSAFPRHHIDTARGRIAYRDSGTGPILLCLHGIGSGSGSWLHQFEALTPRYRLIAWDAPGYGSSDFLATETPRAADYADALAGLVEELTLDHFVMIGHSLGALIAASYAVRHGSHLNALVLAAPARGHAHAEAKVREEKWHERRQSIQQYGPDGLAVRRGPALLRDGASAEALALVQLNMRQLHVAGYSAAAHALAHGDILIDAAQWTGAARVLCGAEDGITPPSGCRQVAETLIGSDYVEIGAAGHVLYVDQPAVFNRHVLNFLEGLP